MTGDEIVPVGRRARLTESVGRRVLDAVDLGIETRWEPATTRAKSLKGRDAQDALSEVKRAFRTELGVAGAAAGGVAAVPGAVAPAIVAGIAEIGWSTVRLTDMILTIAVVHGHDEASVEERRVWVLSVLAFGDGAASTLSTLASEAGRGLGAKATKAIPVSWLQSINRTIGRTIVTKYGTKRGAIALGRTLPFGIGAGLGFGFNALLVEQVARHADKFFRQLPPTERPTSGVEALGGTVPASS
jgi:hypothetical protein